MEIKKHLVAQRRTQTFTPSLDVEWEGAMIKSQTTTEINHHLE